MGDYDGGFKIAANCSGAGLSRLGGIIPDIWEPIGDTLQATERLADRAFRATCGKHRFVVYFEAYTRWLESAPWSVLAKSGLLSERERLPTRALIFVLTPGGYQEQKGTFRLQAMPAMPTQQIWFNEICLWKQKPQTWWEHHPGLMALLPLCDHGQAAARAVALAADSIRHRQMDGLRRADLLTALGFFGKLADRSLDILSIIQREEMNDSPFARELAQYSYAEQARKDLLRVIQLRFGDDFLEQVSDEVARIDALTRLEQLHALAVTAKRKAQVQKALLGQLDTGTGGHERGEAVRKGTTR